MDINGIEKALSEITQQTNHSEIIYEFLLAYGIPQSTITKLKQKNAALDGIDNIVDVKKKVYFLNVAEGNDLPSILERLKNDPATFRHRPRFIIVTDFKRLCAWDCKLKGAALDTKFEDLHINYEFFLPLAGREKYVQHHETFADVKAAEKMAKIYDEILNNNPDFLDEQNKHNLSVFLTRLLFCYFAEDTGIFPEGNIFTKSIYEHTQEDGSDLREYFEMLFFALDDRDRRKYPAHISNFPYVNGKLFADKCKIPNFTKRARDLILECGDGMNWSEINPDIFGSMFQAVSDKKARRDWGQHYTSVPNIMKVITPLFLDELKDAFEKAQDSVSRLSALLHRISEIKIFDPACGSGNFLIIAYKQLRILEIEIIRRIRDLEGGISFNYSQIKLSNFYGIELLDFPCEIARLSLWLAQHQMNILVKKEFGITQPTLPLQESGHIICGNATRLNWDEVCPRIKAPNSLQSACEIAEIENSDLKLQVPPEYNEIYVLGNPPYSGFKFQCDEQKYDIENLFKTLGNYKQLDYISCWLFKAAEYIENSNVKSAFVSTNSICQGEQVEYLWEKLYKFDIEICFAYTSFNWTNNAKYNAGVTCVIIGLQKVQISKKFLFVDGHKNECKHINSYLIDAPDIIIRKRKTPLSAFPKMTDGSGALDGGFLILDELSKNKICKESPLAKSFIKKYMGSKEYINGIRRWCLWIEDSQKIEALSIPSIKDRVEKVYEFRNNAGTRAKTALNRPYKFAWINRPLVSQIIIPTVSSENRDYIPIGYLDSNVIVSNSASIVHDAPIWLLSVLISKIHMVWVKSVSGRLRSDIRYTAAISYNTFPFPNISDQRKRELEYHAKQVLAAREKHSELTMAELYDPEKMPEDLRSAHVSLDIAVEQCYRKRPFDNDEKRLEYLFKYYEKMSAGSKLGQQELEIL